MYTKPVILANTDLAEGVYAASGSAPNCWHYEGISGNQNWNGSHHVFHLKMTHTAGHISDSVSMIVHINGTVVSAYSNDNGAAVTGISGNDIYVTRTNHANAENSTDTVTFGLWVQSHDQPTTEALSVSGVEFTNCEKRTSVNGLY